MSTAALLRTDSAVRPTHRPGFTDLVRSEWTKFTSLRSTWWSLGVMTVVSLGFTVAATATYTHDYPHLDAATQSQFRTDTVGLILQPAAQFAQLAVCVLGVLLIASEYSTGMIRATMLAAPRRTSALLAKAATLAAAVFVLSEVVAVACFLIGSRIVRAHSVVSITDPTSLHAVLGFGAYMTLIGLVALSLGTLLRHPAAGISMVLAMQFVLAGVVGMIPGSVGKHLAGAMPSGATVIMGSGHNASNVYSPAQGLLILLGWVAVLGASALHTVKKRDV
ncbi:ABC transporter permease [Actinospica durhamensis]|uniref:ABC transporter permease n=1 Tax=Actinospica durhamensis TaxID=1508375 RepID=A0A941EPT2_9ACTN|nr:ABC transporter permease [Actinospica durhamensis]MBR7834337.1 ABC transporter permease [Actinospica durhamensis]